MNPRRLILQTPLIFVARVLIAFSSSPLISSNAFSVGTMPCSLIFSSSSRRSRPSSSSASCSCIRFERTSSRIATSRIRSLNAASGNSASKMSAGMSSRVRSCSRSDFRQSHPQCQLRASFTILSFICEPSLPAGQRYVSEPGHLRGLQGDGLWTFNFSPEDEAFRAEFRAWLEKNAPSASRLQQRSSRRWRGERFSSPRRMVSQARVGRMDLHQLAERVWRTRRRHPAEHRL